MNFKQYLSHLHPSNVDVNPKKDLYDASQQIDGNKERKNDNRKHMMDMFSGLNTDQDTRKYALYLDCAEFNVSRAFRDLNVD